MKNQITSDPRARKRVVQLSVIAATAACFLCLSGCGTDPADRLVSGSMLGAAGGAIVGAATGNPATGAAIGAVAGGVAGVVTDPCKLDLGTPYWRRHGGRKAYDERCERH